MLSDLFTSLTMFRKHHCQTAWEWEVYRALTLHRNSMTCYHCCTGDIQQPFKRFFVFAFDQQHALAQEEQCALLAHLGVPYRKCVGYYEGEFETSFMVPANDFFRVRDALAQDMQEQDTVLFVNEHNSAYLLAVHEALQVGPVLIRSQQHIGTWCRATKPHEGGFTYDIRGNSWYAVNAAASCSEHSDCDGSADRVPMAKGVGA